MRTSAIILLMVLPTELPAQGFTSDSAKAAQKKYEAATAAARDAYALDLKEAAKAVLEAGDVEEGIRIEKERQAVMEQGSSAEGDPIVRARKQLEGTVWTWARGAKITLASKRKATSNRDERDGLWEMLEPRTAVVKFRDPVFIMVFNEDYTAYRVIAYDKTNTSFEGGQRQR